MVSMDIHKGILAAIVLPLLAGSAIGTVNAIELPDGFVDETFLEGFDGQITGFDPTSPGRSFVSEKSGIVRVVANGELLSEPFLDIRDIVNDRVDRGMLSVAVHPQFPEQPFVYVLYTYDPPELVSKNLTGAGVQDGNGNRVSRLTRYTADAEQNFNVAVTDSETIILGKNSTFENIGSAEDVFDTLSPSCGPIGSPLVDCLPADEITHTIGALRFASDGSLFVTNGDGASYRSFNAISQMSYDLDSLRGKILRIDAQTGLGLPDNPFYDGNAASNRSRVVSYGLRNPYSMALHPLTDVPYVGEVGEELWEEINGGIGKNFGWPCYEGGTNGNERQTGFEPDPFCQAVYRSAQAIEAPLQSWSHDGNGNAAMIGDFYFGDAFPEEFTGKLFYGDFIRGWLRAADVSDPGNVTGRAFATGMLPMTEMRTGEDGALYYASITTGEIRRIRYAVEESEPTDARDPSIDDPVTEDSPGTDMSVNEPVSESSEPNEPSNEPVKEPADQPLNDADAFEDSSAPDGAATRNVTVGSLSYALVFLMSAVSVLRRRQQQSRIAL